MDKEDDNGTENSTQNSTDKGATIPEVNLEDQEDQADLKILQSFTERTEQTQEAPNTETQEAEAETTSESEETSETEGGQEKPVAKKVTEEEATSEETTAADKVVTEPQQPELTPEQQQAQLEAFQTEAINYLAEKVYTLSDADKEALDTDPASVLPAMAARIHMQAMQAATNNVARLLPQLVAGVLAQQQQSSDFEQQFVSANEGIDLSNPKHKETVLNFARVYKEMNPNVSNEVFIRDVGAQVKVALGITTAAPAAAPVQQENPVQQAFKPAAASGAGGDLKKATPTNMFELMSLEEED